MKFGRTTGLQKQGADALAAGTSTGPLDESALSQLEASLFSENRSVRLSVIDSMQVAGISDDQIVDHYIPDVARRLGAQWCEDDRSFVDVAVGTARLQSMVHDVAVDWHADSAVGSPDAPSVLIAVRADIYHTLGALVAATQFRRHGAVVRLALDTSDDDIIAEAKFGNYDMIALSAAAGEPPKAIHALINSIRDAAGDAITIALGGSFLAGGDVPADIEKVDYCGPEPLEALRFCQQKRLDRQAGGHNPSNGMMAQVTAPA